MRNMSLNGACLEIFCILMEYFVIDNDFGTFMNCVCTTYIRKKFDFLKVKRESSRHFGFSWSPFKDIADSISTYLFLNHQTRIHNSVMANLLLYLLRNGLEYNDWIQRTCRKRRKHGVVGYLIVFEDNSFWSGEVPKLYKNYGKGQGLCVIGGQSSFI